MFPFTLLLRKVDGPGVNISIVRAPGELMTVVVTNLTAFTHYSVTITAFTGPLEHASSDGKAIGPLDFQTLEEGKYTWCSTYASCCTQLNLTK